MIISHKESTKQQSDTIAQALQRDLKKEVARLRMQLSLLKSLNAQLSTTVATLNSAVDSYFKASKLMFKLVDQTAGVLRITIDYSKTEYGSYNAIVSYNLTEAL